MKTMNLKRHKDVAVNIVSQWVVQFANYLVPMLVVPYVSRVLQPEMFGAAGYAQNVVAYLTLLVNFGFSISATQDVALNRNNPAKLSEIFWNVIAFKTLLLAVSFVLLFGLCLFMPRVQQNFHLFFAAALFNVGTVLFPYWFFQGVERLAKMSMFVLCIRLLGLVLVLLCVSAPQHVCRYLYALSAANVAVGLLAFVYVVRTYKLGFVLRRGFCASAVVRKSVPAFLNIFLVNCNMLVGMTLLGWYLSDYELGVYSGAQKIMTAVLMITSQSVSVALFPRVSRAFAEDRGGGLRYLAKVLVAVGLFTALASVAFYFLSPLAVMLMLGENYAGAVPVLLLLSPLPFLTAIATTLTVQGVFAMQLQRFAPWVGGAVFVANVLFCCLLVPAYGMEGAVCACLLCQVVEIVADLLVLCFNGCRKV